MTKKEILVVLIVLSVFFSITVFEGFIILFLLLTIYEVIKNKKIPKGRLNEGVTLFSLPLILSTLIYYPKRFLKAIEEGGFQFVYFSSFKKDEAEKLSRIITFIFAIGFFLLLLVVL